MQAPAHFTIIITGNLADTIARDNVDNGRALGNLLGRLLTGEEIPEHAWHPWRLSVVVEEDMDQGDE
jgi:hypothetical protein